MGFLRRAAKVSLRDKMRSSVIREELGVELLLFYVERSQLTWFRPLVRMPPGLLLMEVFQAHPARRRPQGLPGIPQSELADVVREREVWDPLLKLLPLRPDPE